MKAPEHQWHAVSGSSDLPRGAARAITLLNQDIVIWRGQSGHVRAWQNQCPHRGMRLSFGQVRGDNLSCRYHGWQYDHSGQCVVIPAQPDFSPPATLKVPGFACQERNSLIWVNLGPEDHEDNSGSLMPAGTFPGRPRFCKTLHVWNPVKDLSTLLLGTCFPVFPDFAGCSAPSRLENELVEKSWTPEQTRLSVAWYYGEGPRRKKRLVDYVASTLNSDVIKVSGSSERGVENIVVLALQDRGESGSCIHIVTSDSGDLLTDLNRQRMFIAWCRRLRWFLRNPAAEFDGYTPVFGVTRPPNAAET